MVKATEKRVEEMLHLRRRGRCEVSLARHGEGGVFLGEACEPWSLARHEEERVLPGLAAVFVC